MKTTNQIFIILFFAFLATQTGFAQKSIKQTKQQTQFFYAQVNLNGGMLLSEKSDFRFSEINPFSNINLRYRAKSQRMLQQGFTKFMRPNGFKAHVAFNYINPLNDDETQIHQIKMQMRDVFVSVKTKWDRTSLKVGHFSLPYGHAPKLDFDNSFISVIASQDLGFNRDVGILFKTPVNDKMDMELGVTTGGGIPSTWFAYSAAVKDGETDETFEWSDIDYNGTWLTTLRFGSPTFKKNEFGLFAAVGEVSRTSAVQQESTIYRIGADWTYKYKEKMRMTHQLVFGHTNVEEGDSGLSIVQKSEVDFFWKRKLMVSFSNNLRSQEYSSADKFTGVVVLSFSYALSPHTRLKLNTYNRYSLVDVGNQTGVFLQFVYGIGKRG